MIGTPDTSARDSQLLADLSFDYGGTTFWTPDIRTVVNPVGCGGDDLERTELPSRTGKQITGQAPEDRLRRSTTSETVTIPSTAVKAELEFLSLVVTKDKKPSVY